MFICPTDLVLVNGPPAPPCPLAPSSKVKVKPRRQATREMSGTQFARGVAAELGSVGF